MNIVERLLSTVGVRRLIATLGALYVLLAVGRAIVYLSGGASTGNVLIVTLLIAVPGLVLVWGGYRLPQSDIHPEFYPNVAGWCFAGFAAMASVFLIYQLQPEGGVSSPWTSPPILLALSSVAGYAVGINDSQAKTRTRELEQRNRELEQTQTQLEDTVERLGRYREYTGHVLDAIHDIFYVVQEDGTLQRWNESLCDVTGYSDPEISSIDSVEFFDEDDHEMIKGAIADGFETGSVRVEAELLTKDNEHIPYEFAGTTLETPDGESVLAGIGRDISDRKQRERELEQRARQQQIIAELGQLALETDDLDHLMHKAARQVADVLDNEYCKVLDLDAEADRLLLRQGVGWNDGIVGEATVSAVESDSQAAYTLANNHPIVVEDLETETRFSGPDLLTSHDVKSGISTIIGPFGEPWGILGTHDTESRSFTGEDVTFVQSVATILAEAIERQQYQEDLEQSVADLQTSNERLEQFAYAASHDLQEPLRMVSSYLQLIERRYEDELDEEGQEYLEFAIDGADRMREMVQGLLGYSHVEMRGEALEPVDLNEVVADVREDLDVQIAESDAEVEIEELPHVEGDADQLCQVFQNLVSNALEYSGDETPRVQIAAERNSRMWELSVRDEGIGIDPDEQERIFEVFERLHSPGEHPGSGIGLALSERIIERHGGDIWVDSEPGEGSTFSFTLPAVGERDERARGGRTGRYSPREG